MGLGAFCAPEVEERAVGKGAELGKIQALKTSLKWK